MYKIKEYLSRHAMFETLFKLKGNPKACVYSEPLWGIPYALYVPFATLYMYELGIKDKEIGLLLTIGMVFQGVASLVGGVACDKWGRRRTTIIFDILSWSVPTLIWSISQNFWFFLIATILNSMWQITNNSWTCLLVEDCDPKELVNVYTWINISMLLSVFFAPISSMFVKDFSVVPTMRVLYIIACISMTAKFIVLYLMGTETQQGKKRMLETKDTKFFILFSEYREIIKKIFKDKGTCVALSLKIIINITSMVTGTFLSLYVTEQVLLPSFLVGYFPIARAIIMLLFIFGVQYRINRLNFRPVMLTGTILYLISNMMLVITSKGNLILVLIYVVFDAFAYALLIPRNDSILALFVDSQERARVLGLIYVIMIAVSAPFGYIAGYLSDINRVLPFIFNIICYLVCAMIIIFSKALKKHDNNELEIIS